MTPQTEQRIAEIEMQFTNGLLTRREADIRIKALKSLKTYADSVKDHKIIE